MARGPYRRSPALLGGLFVFLLLGGGCAGGKSAARAPVAPVPPAGPMVAIAPMENRTNDLDASEIVRAAFGGEIALQGWNVMATADSDRVLRETLGISYGGQLKAATPDEVCRALGVAGVFYGSVKEWNKTTTGIYNSVSVAASFRLYRADGSLAWEGSDRRFQQLIPRGGGREIGGEILGNALVNLLMNPMTRYGMSAGRNIAKKLPLDALAPAPSGAPDEPPPAVAADDAPRVAPKPEPETPAETGGTK